MKTTETETKLKYQIDMLFTFQPWKHNTSYNVSVGQQKTRVLAYDKDTTMHGALYWH